MNIFRRHNRRQVPIEDWEQAYRYGQNKHVKKTPRCPACNNTRICDVCQGDGCADCDYTGICAECVTWPREEGE